MTSELRSQLLQSPKLQLLHRAFAATEPQRDLADTLFFREAHYQDAALILSQFINQSKQQRSPFALFQIFLLGRISAPGYLRACVSRRRARLVERHFPGRAFRSIGDHVRRNSEQPRRERRTAPLESREAGERLVKDFAR